MQQLHEMDYVIVPNMGKPKSGFYMEPKLLIGGMSEMPEFEVLFKKYHFKWMTRESDRYSPTPVQEFSVTYLMVLRRIHLQVFIWNGGDPLCSLMIWGVWVNVST